MRAWKNLMAAAVLTAVVVAPAAAQGGGNDGWTTPGGGQTSVDLSQYPDVLGSPVVGGPIVTLKGKPLDSRLGTIDTLLERGDITWTDGTGRGSLRIVALSLESERDIVLQDGRAYHLHVGLSDTSAGTGSITLTRSNPDGGTFSSSFPVLPKLTFTNVSDPGDALTVDCASGGCPPLNMSSSNSAWVTSQGPSPGNFDPAAAGVTPIQSGITLSNGYTTVGNTNGSFYAGITPNRPSYTPTTINEQDLLASHNVAPARDCARTSTTSNLSAKSRRGKLETRPSLRLCAFRDVVNDPVVNE
jgi:hypothetical protein